VSWNPVNNTYAFTPPNDGITYTFNFPNYLAIQCGFPYNPSASYNLSNTSPLTSILPAQMMVESLLLMNTTFPIVPSANLDNLTSVDNSVQDTTALLKIPLEMPPYDMLVWRAHDVELQRKRLANHHIARVDVTITDENGRPLQMTTDWTLSFVVEFWAPISLTTTIQTMANDVSRMRAAMQYLALKDEEKKSS
jgi:hypothetical protein